MGDRGYDQSADSQPRWWPMLTFCHGLIISAITLRSCLILPNTSVRKLWINERKQSQQSQPFSFGFYFQLISLTRTWRRMLCIIVSLERWKVLELSRSSKSYTDSVPNWTFKMTFSVWKVIGNVHQAFVIRILLFFNYFSRAVITPIGDKTLETSSLSIKNVCR